MLAVSNTKFVIPPGADDFEVAGNLTLGHDVELLDLQPHMHVRGKSAEMQAVYPTGESEKLLLVPKYDFGWQMNYKLPEGKILPKGTKIIGVNHYDNSPNNKHNPDATKEVRWGDQSWEEMMINFFSVAVDVNVKPGELVERKPAAPRAD